MNDNTNIHFKKLKQSTIKITDKNTGYNKTTTRKVFELPNGLIETFFIDNDKDSVCILPITKENQVILIRQFRAGQEKIQLELPGGGLEALEEPIEAAMRELKEECGIIISKREQVVHLASVQYNPYSSGMRHCFMVTECTREKNKQDLDPNEFLDVVEMSLDEFREKIKRAEIRGYEIGYLGLDKLGVL